MLGGKKDSMADKIKQNQYMLRSTKVSTTTESKVDGKMGGKTQRNYDLNQEKALSKKAAKTKDEIITHTVKTNNLVIKMNTAAYEMTKKSIKADING